MEEERTGEPKLRLANTFNGMEKRMTWLYGGLAGLVIGVGSTIGVIKATRQPQQPIAIPESVVAEKLTDLDLVKPLCSEEFIEQHGPGLCREVWCLMQTRGIDSKTGERFCESISNVNNTLSIIAACEGSEDCERLFRERK
tara:strand:- start:106 stop:528 length:423 start_codon:yes stop_codon:yes gene_type:complete